MSDSTKLDAAVQGVAPPIPAGLAIAVLPFRYRGPAAEQHVAEGLTDELIDALASTKGLRVAGSGTTARFAGDVERDPRSIGAHLRVDAIVDGTAQLAGSRLRVNARLVDVETGFQLWSERYDTPLDDPFEVQDLLGKRIAEALRIELAQIAYRGDAPAEAIDLHVRAQVSARVWAFKGPSGAIAGFEACLALAPAFAPALAALAVVAVKTSFLPRQARPGVAPPVPAVDERDWTTLAEQAVARALVGAPELAESQLASGMLAAHAGRYHDAARALRRALAIAPTFAAAHEYLGRLELEAGLPDQGAQHLGLALALDPSLVFAVPEIARYHALRGDYDECERTLARHGANEATNVAVTMLRVRVASWQRRKDLLEPKLEVLLASSMPTFSIAELARMMLGSPSADAIADQLERLLGFAHNPRFASLMCQLGAELAGYHGHDELAMRCIERAAGGVLVDLDWLDRCPLFAPLRERPEWAAARQLVQARAEAIWAG